MIEVTLVMKTVPVIVSVPLRFLVLLVSEIASVILVRTWLVASSLSPRVLRLAKIVSESWVQVLTYSTAAS